MIQVENLSKRYRVDSRERYGSLRDVVIQAFYFSIRHVASLISL